MPLANAPEFEPALADLQDHLPGWWATSDPSSTLYQLLDAIGVVLDRVSAGWQQAYTDQVLTTASPTGLRRNFAFAWGLENEQLPAFQQQLVAYIQARAQEDGSLASLINTLTSLVDTPANVTGGPLLTFPAGGGGLTFPADGSGLTLYQFAANDPPSTMTGLQFPAGGGGLIFPIDPGAVASDNTIIDDGTIPIGAGPGLTFASNKFVQIQPSPSTYRMTVKVQSWLAFDRAAFARAVERFQAADWLPALVVETSF